MNTDWRVMEFIRYGMDINPDQRPTASQLLRHPIFQLLGTVKKRAANSSAATMFEEV